MDPLELQATNQNPMMECIFFRNSLYRRIIWIGCKVGSRWGGFY